MVRTEKTQEGHRTQALPLLTLGRLAGCLFLSVGVVGCATVKHDRIEHHLVSNPDQAVALIVESKSAYGKNGRALYLMDHGMALHLDKQYQASNVSLEEAERLIENLYTRSLMREAAALVTNDYVRPYEGEHFEQVMIHVIMAINYAQLGLLDDALVEARKVDHKLNLLADRYEEKYAYTQDALARYLNGILFEARGELNDAFIAYRLAYEAFQMYQQQYGMPMPALIGRDLLRLSDALHLVEEHEQYQQAFPSAEWQPVDAGVREEHGELVVLSAHGRAPLKKDLFLDIPFSADALRLVLAAKSAKVNDTVQDVMYGLDGHVFRVVLPKFVPQPSKVSHAEISLTGGGDAVTGRTVLIEDITAIAEQDLKDSRVRTSLRAVARAGVKFALCQLAAKKYGSIAEKACKVASMLTEKSDKRSWRTLPGEIQVARFRLPPGTYQLRIDYIGKQGLKLEQTTLPSIEIKAGETNIVSRRTML